MYIQSSAEFSNKSELYSYQQRQKVKLSCEAAECVVKIINDPDEEAELLSLTSGLSHSGKLFHVIVHSFSKNFKTLVFRKSRSIIITAKLASFH